MLIEDKKLRQQLCDGAKRIFEEKLKWSAIAARYKNIID